ncbi:hypothetical protein FXO38_28794 [Capsicum annuum]|nr:hypothetical protein FXO38_28794 [Capsicum annuum]
MLQIVPLWVTLLGLQVYYWSKENLSRIASKIGKPICANRLTAEIERNSFMRLFIEVDVTQALPTEIYIEEEGSIRTQQVDYDWHPIACPDCEKWDHEQETTLQNNKKGGDIGENLNCTHQGPDGKSATSEGEKRGKKVKVTVIDTAAHLIHCKVEDIDTTFYNNMTFIYGHNTMTERSLWSHLKSLAKQCNEPWIILGDFNAVLSHSDRLNGELVTPQETKYFQDYLDEIEMGQMLCMERHMT